MSGARGVRQQGLLGGEEDADVTGRGIEGADEGHDQQGPEVPDEGESGTGGGHQEGGSDQQRPAWETVGDQSDKERQRRRPHERRGGDCPDLQGVEATFCEVEGKQDADEPIAEGAHRAGTKQHPRFRRRPGRKQPSTHGGQAVFHDRSRPIHIAGRGGVGPCVGGSAVVRQSYRPSRAAMSASHAPVLQVGLGEGPRQAHASESASGASVPPLVAYPSLAEMGAKAALGCGEPTARWDLRSGNIPVERCIERRRCPARDDQWPVDPGQLPSPSPRGSQ